MKNRILGALLALASTPLISLKNAFTKTTQQPYRAGTYGKRTRTKGKPNPAGTKFKRQCEEGRVGIRGSLTPCTRWAIARAGRPGKRLSSYLAHSLKGS